MYQMILLFSLSVLLTMLILPFFRTLLVTSRCTSYNYQKNEIPTALGLIFIFIQIITTLLSIVLLNKDFILSISYNFSMVFIGLLGFIDDVLGETHVKGLKGHITTLLNGRLTTGGLKALGGMLSSVFFSSIASKSIWDVMLNTLIIALFTNLINLFDLRPGRSIKLFIFFGLSLLIISRLHSSDYFLISMFGIISAYFYLDIKGLAMMGDTGSNVLGFTLGVYCILTQTHLFKLVYLFILIGFHIISEKVSFSKVIDNNKVLGFLDHLGR